MAGTSEVALGNVFSFPPLQMKKQTRFQNKSLFFIESRVIVLYVLIGTKCLCTTSSVEMFTKSTAISPVGTQMLFMNIALQLVSIKILEC